MPSGRAGGRGEIGEVWGGSMTKSDKATTARNEGVSGPVFQDIARFRGILFDGLLRPHDITMAQGWAVLSLMREAGQRQADLAAKLDIGPVTTSKLIDRLEARGFVERRADPGDRRSKRIFATDKAHQLMDIMTETQRQVDTIANTGIEPEELVTAMKVLAKMRQNLKASMTRD